MPIQDIWPKTVPDVTGDDQATAEATLTALLIPFIYGDAAFAVGVATGDVATQSPVGGSTMNLTDPPVTLTLSLGDLGSTAALVPSVLGLNVDAAIQRIRNAGFYVLQLVYVDINYLGAQTAPNIVHNQSPAGLAAALLDSAVSLVVTTGSAFYATPVSRYRFQSITYQS